MAEIDWVWYDTVVFGAAANTAFEAFQVQLGADATHNEQFTNLPLPGQIPQNEKFAIEKISVQVDFVPTTLADLRDFPVKAVLEVKRNDTLVYKAPLAEFVDNSSFMGVAAIAAAASQVAGGSMNDGHTFKRAIQLNGGDFFKIRIVQGTAITAASNLKVLLHGTRTTT